MVQILPAVPREETFGNELARVLTQAFGDVGAAYIQGKRKERTEKADADIIKSLDDPNLSPSAKAAQISKLSVEKQKALVPLYSGLLKEQQKTHGQQADRQSALSKINGGQSGSPSAIPPQPPPAALQAQDGTGPTLGETNAPPGQAPQATEAAKQEKRPFEDATDAQLAQFHGEFPSLRPELEFERKLRESQKNNDVRGKVLSKEQAKNDIAYWDNVQATKRADIFKGDTLSKLKQLSKQGVSGKTYDKALETARLIQFTSDGRREFSSLAKNLLTDLKQVLGSQFSQREFEVIRNSYPNEDFSPEANAAIIKNIEEAKSIRDEEEKIGLQLKKENKGQIPENFQEKVNERLQDYVAKKAIDVKKNNLVILNDKYKVPEGKTLMFDPDGDPLYVDPDQVERYEKFGASLP